MNEKQLADRLREIADHAADADIELRLLADELDPSKPKPGTVVIRSDGAVGFVDDKATVYFHNGRGMRWDYLGTRWKPVRILGPRQVAVDVPPVGEWPGGEEEVFIDAHLSVSSGSYLHYRRVITREEAERMEERDE